MHPYSELFLLGVIESRKQEEAADATVLKAHEAGSAPGFSQPAAPYTSTSIATWHWCILINAGLSVLQTHEAHTRSHNTHQHCHPWLG